MEKLGRYTIDVSFPPDPDDGAARYPVILTTDGNILFDLMQVVARGRFTRLSPVLPASILGDPATRVTRRCGRRRERFPRLRGSAPPA